MAVPLDHHHDAMAASGVVTSCVGVADGSVITVARRRGPASFRLPVRPDPAAARSWAQAWRRVDRVVLVVGPESVSARVAGTAHRLPRVAGVPVSIALGLASSGVPTTVKVSEP